MDRRGTIIHDLHRVRRAIGSQDRDCLNPVLVNVVFCQLGRYGDDDVPPRGVDEYVVVLAVYSVIGRYEFSMALNGSGIDAKVAKEGESASGVVRLRVFV